MLKGFMDHWVPTQSYISKFWNSDFETVKNEMDSLKDEVNYNNFTFYTKWYTNGIKTNLPYLNNNPGATNVKTSNKWGRQIIEHLHNKGCTVGAMMQLLTYESNVWDNEMSVDTWDVRKSAETDSACNMADFTKDEYIARIREIVKEQLEQFPAFDYLFFEFEGLSENILKKVYLREKGLPSLGVVTYSDETRDYCAKTGIALDFRWSDEGREMIKRYFKKAFKALYDLLSERGYKGEVGVVYHLYGYEAFIFPKILPDNQWILLPWWYWVFERPGTPENEIQARKQASKELLRKWKNENHRIFYVGDVTMGQNGAESIKEFYNYSKEIGLDGYIGMGNPETGIGLRWHDVDDGTIISVRKLYRDLYK